MKSESLKLRIVKLKTFISQAYQWYGMFFNGPMIVYAAWKLTPETGFFNRQMFLIVISIAIISLLAFTFIYFKYLYPTEIELCFHISDKWQKMGERK